MKYILLVLAAIAHTALLNLGSTSESLQWLWNGLTFGVVWATGLAAGEHYGN